MTESTAKSTAKAAPKKKKAAPKKPLQAYRCVHPDHDQTRPWSLTVATKAHRVEVKGTQRGGAESGVTHFPTCPSCAKTANKAAGPDGRGGSVAVEVSEVG